ncbi:MAG: SGNH/GDSL hydrolase family protein [Candidatus Saccharibacteria bacterium]
MIIAVNSRGDTQSASPLGWTEVPGFESAAATYADVAYIATSSTSAFTGTWTQNSSQPYTIGVMAFKPDVPLDPLAQWKTARATVASIPKVLVVGDSIAEGQGASVKTNRWQDILNGALRTNAGLPAGGAGFVPNYYAVAGSSSPWGNTAAGNLTGTLNTDYDYETWIGLGGRGVQLNDTTATETFTVYGDNAEIWYADGYGSGTSFKYQIDSGSVITVTYTSTYSQGLVVPVALGSVGSHTIKIMWNAGTPSPEGIYVYNGDKTTGIHFYDHTHSGATTDAYIGSDQDTIIIPKIAPDLAIIELVGVNDFQNSYCAPSQTLINVQAAITELNALTKVPSIVLLIPYAVESPTTNTLGYTWADYVTQLLTITESNVTIVNLYSLWGTSNGTGYYDSDGIHPSDAGHAQIASILAGVLDPMLTSLPWFGFF